MSLWTVVILAGVGSLALRVSFLAVASVATLPPGLQRYADLVYPAGMAAILAGAAHGVAAAHGYRQLAVLAPAAVVTAIVTRYTRSVLGAIGSGLAMVLVISAIAGA